MYPPLLATKFYLPTRHEKLVSRPSLFSRLDRWQAYRLTLVSAPAGFGKTTLVATWAKTVEARGDATICWLSLEREDDDLTRFFRYLAGAVQPLDLPNPSLPILLQSAQKRSANQLATTFLQDILPAASPFIVVLDDFHFIRSAEIEAALAYHCRPNAANDASCDH